MDFGVEEAEEPSVMKGRSFSCAVSLSRKEEPALAGDTLPPTKVGTLFIIQLNGAPKGAPLQAHCTSAQFLLTLELAKFASSRQHNVVDKPRCPHIRGDGDQRASRRVRHGIQRFRIDDSEVVQPDSRLLRNHLFADLA